jgi:pilus assembly protein CpaC
VLPAPFPGAPLPALPPTPAVGVPLATPNGGVPTYNPTFNLPSVVSAPEQAVFQQPDLQPKAGGGPAEQLPQPKQFPFGPDAVRLPRLGGPPQLGATPVPTPQELERERQFIDKVVDPQNTLDLIQGRSRVILLKATPTRTQVADPAVVTFRLLEPVGNQMIIIGARPGITVLTLWFADPKNKDKEEILSYLVRVFPDPEEKERLEAIYKALEIEVNKAFPKSRVRLRLIGDKLMVSGQAHDIYDATQILRVLRANAPGGQGQQGNTQVANRFPVASLVPTGNPLDPLRPSLTPGLESYEQTSGSNVINDLRVPGEQQVMLRVTVAEVSRAAARSIGVNFSIINNRGTQVFAQNTGNLTQGTVNLPINLDNGQIPIALDALRTLNYARSLAEPNLTAMNGQVATFLAGGQFPVPVIGGFGAIGGVQGVQFVPFGVQLFFTPIITDRDRIRLTVNAVISTRDVASGTNVGGSNVPGLTARTFSTTVELREGQTLAVAGLIANNLGADSSRVPLAGDLPIIGPIFSSNRISHGESELIFLVTPELIHPLEQKEISPLPGSDIYEPGDIEFYLCQRMESRRSYDYRSNVMTDIHRMLRYRKCEQIYIVGPSGHVDPPAPALGPPAGKQ